MEHKSLKRSLQTCDDGCPNMNRTCFVFSTNLGAAFKRNFFPARVFGGLKTNIIKREKRRGERERR